MAKKTSFADKVKKAASKEESRQYIKWVKAYKGENGAWKFRTVNLAVTDENRKEIYG